ncbi:MAG: hypothetical protein IJA07_02715 [Agathobacter sp.]|nr:hypothetical protein [Agathobacter sp.]
MKSENKIYQITEFTGEHIPVKEAARIMGEDIEKGRIKRRRYISMYKSSLNLNGFRGLFYCFT